ncbi:glycosyltransferase [Tomitella biformata]|uniref:glycosyltransferase n=1 Tax=Tomitella biformata TaxID=630403 RepID=UPI000466A9B4|nr:glycosyltransferase [Tomitella biformata]
MRVAVVAGPEAGHAIPAIELCRRLVAAGDSAVLLSGTRWADAAATEGFEFIELKGLAPRPGDDDADEGAKLHGRAAHVSTEILADLRAIAPDLVVSDTITVGGGLAAERLGIPWVELVPHPLYLPSKGLPPLGSGLAPGVGVRGRIRDVVLRAMTDASMRRGAKAQRAARLSVGLPAAGRGPVARLIATLPALEVPRPDWPDNAYVVGPLVWDPTTEEMDLPPGSEPLILVAPSTATNDDKPLAEAALGALAPELMGEHPVRVAITTFGPIPSAVPEWARAGRSRQEQALKEAAVVVCGAGHGMLAKALLAGAPVVAVPGGGDQWELARRAERAGYAVLVKPLTEEALTAAVRTILADYERYSAAAVRAQRGADAVVDAVAVCRRAAGVA